MEESFLDLSAMEFLESRKEIDAVFDKWKEANLRDDSNLALESMVKEAQSFLQKVNPQSKLLSVITVTDVGMKWNFRAFKEFTSDSLEKKQDVMMRDKVMSEVVLMYVEALYREAAYPKYPYLS